MQSILQTLFAKQGLGWFEGSKYGHDKLIEKFSQFFKNIFDGIESHKDKNVIGIFVSLFQTQQQYGITFKVASNTWQHLMMTLSAQTEMSSMWVQAHWWDWMFLSVEEDGNFLRYFLRPQVKQVS